MIVESPKSSAEGSESGSGLSPTSNHRVHEIPHESAFASSDDDEAAEQASRSCIYLNFKKYLNNFCNF